MTQIDLLTAPASRPVRARRARETAWDRLERLFLQRPGEWLDGMLIARVAGVYAWRTRVSDLRYAPWHMTIENRQRRLRGKPEPDGAWRVYTLSEYRYTPSEARAADGTP